MKILKINYSSTSGEIKEITREIEESKFNAFKQLYTTKIIEMYEKALCATNEMFTSDFFSAEEQKQIKIQSHIKELAETIKFELI